MKAKYCIIPDTAKFFEFLAGLSLTESDLLHTRLIRPLKILMDVEGTGNGKLSIRLLLRLKKGLLWQWQKNLPLLFLCTAVLNLPAAMRR